MAVVFVEVDGLLGEGLEVAVVVLDTGLVNDDLGVLDHIVTDIRFGVELVRAGNGDVAVDVDPPLQVLTFQNRLCDAVFMPAAKTNDPVLMEGPFGQMGGKGGFPRAGNTEVDVQDMGVAGAEERARKDQEIDTAEDNQDSHRDKLLFQTVGTVRGRRALRLARLPLPALHAQQAGEQADAEAHKGDYDADEQQGLTGHGLSHSTDPADSGGKDLGNTGKNSSHSHLDNLRFIVHTSCSFLRDDIFDYLDHQDKADKTK